MEITLSQDVASRSDITPCNKIDKPLVVYIFSNVTSRTYLDGEERAGCLALFVFLVSRDCCVALHHDAMCLSAFYDCGFS